MSKTTEIAAALARSGKTCFYCRNILEDFRRHKKLTTWWPGALEISPEPKRRHMELCGIIEEKED